MVPRTDDMDIHVSVPFTLWYRIQSMTSDESRQNKPGFRISETEVKLDVERFRRLDVTSAFFRAGLLGEAGEAMFRWS